MDSEDTVHYVPPTASDPAASAGLRGFRRQPEPGEPSGFSNGRVSGLRTPPLDMALLANMKSNQIYPNPRNPYLPTPPRPQEQCSERASPRSEAVSIPSPSQQFRASHPKHISPAGLHHLPPTPHRTPPLPNYSASRPHAHFSPPQRASNRLRTPDQDHTSVSDPRHRALSHLRPSARTIHSRGLRARGPRAALAPG